MNRQNAATVRRLKAAFSAFTEQVTTILSELEHANNVGSIAYPEIEACLNVACDKYNVTIEQIIQRKRHAAIAWARQVAIYLASKKTRHTPEAIAQVFVRTRPNILYAVREVETRMSVDKAIKAEVEELLKKL